MSHPTCTHHTCTKTTHRQSNYCRSHHFARVALTKGAPIPNLTHVPEHARIKALHTRSDGTYTAIIAPLTPTELEHANCQSIGHEIFFQQQHEPHTTRTLLNMCNSCPILRRCQEVAIAQQEYGYQGGLTANERKAIRKLRKQRLEIVDD
jgi:hypothetical protein